MSQENTIVCAQFNVCSDAVDKTSSPEAMKTPAALRSNPSKIFSFVFSQLHDRLRFPAVFFTKSKESEGSDFPTL